MLTYCYCITIIDMRIITIAVLFCVTLASQAQTNTPTPTSTAHPNALNAGMYQFEDLESPQIELTGVWSIDVEETTETLFSDEDGATLTMNITPLSDYLVIYRAVTTTSFSTWSLCVDDMPCLTISDYGTGGIEPVAVELADTYSEIVITKTNAQASKFDFMTISIGQDAIINAVSTIAAPNIVIVPLIATPITTPTPNSVTYAEATDEAGYTVYTRRENTITTGDEFNAQIFTMILIVLISMFMVMIWKR